MKFWSTALAVLILGTAAQVAPAGDCCSCQNCGCQCQCRRVTCRLVSEVKKEKYYIYACGCEDFALPGPNKKCPCCNQCGGQCGCGGCGCAPHECCKPQNYTWQPTGCCHLFHRNTLKKYECEREICCYKCVVVELCPSCCDHMKSCGAMVEEGGAPAGKGPAPAPAVPAPPKAPSASVPGTPGVVAVSETN